MTLLTLFATPAASSVALGIAADFQLGITPRPEYVYVGTEADSNESGANDQEALHKFRIVSATAAANGQGRLRQLIGVANGQVHVQSAPGWAVFDDATDPQFATDAPFYWYVELGGKAYIGDGITEAVYDPIKGTLVALEASKGELPEKCNLACAYRRRLVLARGQKWYMSKVEDPTNWDYFPPVPTKTDAVADSTIEKFAGDTIQTLIPWQDDYLLLGCSGSILLMRGDPLFGGEIDLIADKVGMTFGNSWTRDQGGMIYFFGSHGGVWRMAPGGMPQKLSDLSGSQDVTIQDELESINFNDYRMELEWDHEHDELVVNQIPYSEASTDLNRQWRWAKKTNAWWPDRVGSADLIAYSSWAGDGDLASDRTLIYGCKDGYLRSVDDLAKNDDEVPIDSYVTIGPLRAGGQADQEIAMNRIKAILSREQGGCAFEVFAADSPEALNEYAYDKLAFKGELEPGQNPRLPVRVRGSYLWVRLRNKKVGEGFAVEEIAAQLVPRGTRRVNA